MARVKRFSSVMKETKSQEKSRKNSALSSGGLVAGGGLVGSSSILYNNHLDKVGKFANRVRESNKKDLQLFEDIDRKITNRASQLKRSAPNLQSKMKVDINALNARKLNLLELDRRGKVSNKALKKGMNVLNRSLNKKLAIAAGASALAGIGAGMTVNKLAKDRNIKLNQNKR